MRRIQFLLALAVLGLCGCAHGQVTPSQGQVVLTWTAPANTSTWTLTCATSPCTYIISRATASGNTCPTPNITTPNYTPINQSSPAAALTLTDTGAAGTTACYIAQTIQAGAASQPSNVAGPLTVPGTPVAPTLNGTASISAAATKATLEPLNVETKPMTLSAKVVMPKER
jgi:hypothetical protein